MAKVNIYLIFLLFSCRALTAHNGICNPTFTTQLGDHIATFVLAKILSLKYEVPFYYVPFKYSDLFKFDETESKLDHNDFKKHVAVSTEKDITNNLNKENILFYTNFHTIIDGIHPSWIKTIRETLRLKEIPIVNDLPENIVTIAVHIRKANGGGERDEGNQRSEQYFDFDCSLTEYVYINNFSQFTFDWMTFIRFSKGSSFIPKNYLNKNGVIEYSSNVVESANVSDNSYYTNYPLDHGCPIKYAPDQYYVDQIKKISSDLGDIPLFVQIFTDDKDPLALVKRVKSAVNKSNIIFHYENYRKKPYREQIAKDLYSMSRFDILIRSHSYFCKIAEFIGDHKLVIFPLESRWLTPKKLIMTKVAIKGNLNSTKCSFLESNKIYADLFKDKDLILQLDTQDENGLAPLHIAAKEGNIYAVKSLIHAGSNINIQDRNGNTPLMYAMMNQHMEIVKYLREKKADIKSL